MSFTITRRNLKFCYYSIIYICFTFNSCRVYIVILQDTKENIIKQIIENSWSSPLND